VASEFELIARHFTRPCTHTILGVGDDGAIIRPSSGMDLVVSTDMLVAGTHFFSDTDPEALGWKTLAVNLSDLAAMGATPRWAVLAAALPAADEAWIAAFCRGFFGLAERFDVDVIGGDTTRGPLNLAPTVFGEVPAGLSLTRSGAHPGDDIWVSGSPGLAALALANLQDRVELVGVAAESCLRALLRPEPRIELGIGLRGIAHAAIDVSDGLLGDLGHILERSAVGALIRVADLPQDALQAAPERPILALQCLLAGGDDYELLFTAAPDKRTAITALGQELDLALSRIGAVTPGPGDLAVVGADGHPLAVGRSGYDHFA
jgi:thiamine-monophosphate kinase